MTIPVYFAMTAAEVATGPAFSGHLAWMACHFSPSGQGLSNLPKSLPVGSMLILDDSLPPDGHDPGHVAGQLHKCARALRCDSILLDLQRPKNQETDAIIAAIIQDPPCPVGLPPDYARPGFPVFLPPVPLDISLETYLSLWSGTEIWLEIAPAFAGFRIDATGCVPMPSTCPMDTLWQDETLHCHYAMVPGQDHIQFILRRSLEDIPGLLVQAETLGVTKAVGLWQELQGSAT